MQSTEIQNGNFENDLKSELYKYMPKEIIINSEILNQKWLSDYLRDVIHCSAELVNDFDYNDFVVEEDVKNQFAGKTFGIEMSRCLWQLINYLSQTQMQRLLSNSLEAQRAIGSIRTRESALLSQAMPEASEEKPDSTM